MHRAGVLCALLIAAPNAAASEETRPEPPAAGAGRELLIFPAGHLYQVHIADPHRPGAAISVESYTSTEIEGASDKRIHLRLGGRFGLLRWLAEDPGGRSWQLSLEAGLDALFDYDLLLDNIGWDGNYGFSVTSVKGGGRRAYLFGILHTSAHIGDEWIARTGRSRINYTREEARAAISSRLAPKWRTYLEAGYAYSRSAILDVMDPLRAQAGLEFESPESLWKGKVGWFAATDLQAWEERDWRPDITFQTGLMFDRTGRVWRLGIEYRNGRVPLGEYFQDSESVLTVGIWSEL